MSECSFIQAYHKHFQKPIEKKYIICYNNHGDILSVGERLSGDVNIFETKDLIAEKFLLGDLNPSDYYIDFSDVEEKILKKIVEKTTVVKEEYFIRKLKDESNPDLCISYNSKDKILHIQNKEKLHFIIYETEYNNPYKLIKTHEINMQEEWIKINSDFDLYTKANIKIDFRRF